MWSFVIFIKQIKLNRNVYILKAKCILFRPQRGIRIRLNVSFLSVLLISGKLFVRSSMKVRDTGRDVIQADAHLYINELTNPLCSLAYFW